jgi:hypothetical protein
VSECVVKSVCIGATRSKSQLRVACVLVLRGHISYLPPPTSLSRRNASHQAGVLCATTLGATEESTRHARLPRRDCVVASQQIPSQPGHKAAHTVTCHCACSWPRSACCPHKHRACLPCTRSTTRVRCVSGACTCVFTCLWCVCACVCVCEIHLLTSFRLGVEVSMCMNRAMHDLALRSLAHRHAHRHHRHRIARWTHACTHTHIRVCMCVCARAHTLSHILNSFGRANPMCSLSAHPLHLFLWTPVCAHRCRSRRWWR